MIMRIAVPAKYAVDDPRSLQLAEGQAAGQASAWTAPVHVETSDGLHVYEVDAVPRSIITTANIAPTLLAPR